MKISEDVKKLEQDYDDLLDEFKIVSKSLMSTRMELKAKNEIIEHYIPVKIHVCKSRRNTTVKFADGTSVTVKRKQGEKDCIETALAYAIMKQCYSPKFIKNLINEKEEH